MITTPRIQAVSRDISQFLPGLYWLNYFGPAYRDLMDGCGGHPPEPATAAVLGERDVPDLDLIGLANEDRDADHPVGVVDLDELPAVEVAAHVLLGVVRLEQER